MKRILLIDGDIAAYISASRSQTSIDWDGNGDKTTSGNFKVAKAELTRMLETWKETLDADEAVICLSDPTRHYFRHDLYPEYKQHRTHGSAPVDLPDIRKLMRGGMRGFTTKWKPSLEADDVLGILATAATGVGDKPIIVTTDKDLNQIPGLHYNPTTKSVTDIVPFEADQFFHCQCLSGDATDGVPGCQGIGPIKARRLIEATPLGKEWIAIETAYLAAGHTKEYALQQAQCVRICRDSDWNFAEGKVITWTPTSL